MARKKKEEVTPLDRIYELIDEQVEIRGQAVLTIADTSTEIARLTSEARRVHNAPMSELTKRIRVMKPKTRKMESVTRQAINLMLGTYEGRREPQTTRASRKRNVEPAGQLNIDALK